MDIKKTLENRENNLFELSLLLKEYFSGKDYHENRPLFRAEWDIVKDQVSELIAVIYLHDQKVFEKMEILTN